MNPIRRIIYTLLNAGGVALIAHLLKFDPWLCVSYSLLLSLCLAIFDRLEMESGEETD